MRQDTPPKTAKAADGKKPGPFDVLEEHMEFSDLLFPQGWSFVRQESGGAQLWQRPGDPSSEYSARAYLNGRKILTVHSDATGLPYGPSNSLTIAQLFAELHFGGDMGLAAKMLISAAHDRRSVVASIVPMPRWTPSKPTPVRRESPIGLGKSRCR